MQLFASSSQVRIQFNHIYSILIFKKTFFFQFKSEFKLANSNWEKEMINHFTYANSNSKTSEQLRLIDLENIGKCLPNLTDQTTKKEILVEMLRTVSYDTRVYFDLSFFILLDLLLIILNKK